MYASLPCSDGPVPCISSASNTSFSCWLKRCAFLLQSMYVTLYILMDPNLSLFLQLEKIRNAQKKLKYINRMG
ncbi:hypothetical protein K435DRAFT_504146 [Dendrothele bispora CBS 962.96]|uniref:Uncharacterized protein n=1 Tax=Dendrothele bispora (strain CBS 962.96) TaxID=1314807 RepID=A0A4S8MAG7_DENBC|nr:hypothetical protein K435DRAFT_504146 [Dendrothele bispora CBS 962.96]